MPQGYVQPSGYPGYAPQGGYMQPQPPMQLPPQGGYGQPVVNQPMGGPGGGMYELCPIINQNRIHLFVMRTVIRAIVCK